MADKVIVVTGIPGVGKTTVLKEVSNLIGKNEKEIGFVTYSSIMIEIATEEGYIVNRDDLRHLSIKTQKTLQQKAAKKIAEISKDKKIQVIDTHMIIRTDLGYWVGLPQNVLEIIKPDLFVLIEAEPNEILSRRRKDDSRSRDEVLQSEINEEIDYSRSVAATCATFTGSPIKCFKNPQGEQVKAAKHLMDLIWKSDE
jgi:adenylate kinase